MTLLKPFLALSLMISLVVYILALYAGPNAMQTLRNYITQVRTDLVAILVREGTFQNLDNGLTFHIAGRAPGGQLKGVFILDRRNDKETLTYLARLGSISKVGEKTFLILQDGEIQRQNNETSNLSVIKYNSYAYDLSGFGGSKEGAIQRQAEIPTWHLIKPDPSETFYQLKPERYRAEFHKRFTSGLYPIMVGLLVLVFVGNPSSNRQGQGIAIAAVASLVVVLRALSIVAEGALRNIPDAAFVVWGIPLLACAIAIYYLATDRNPVPKELQTRIRNFLSEKTEGATRTFRRFAARLTLRRPAGGDA